MVDGRRAIADGALSCRTRLRARSVGDRHHRAMPARILAAGVGSARDLPARRVRRSEEHTSELQSLMGISYAVFCLNTTYIHESQHTRLNHRTNYDDHIET